MFCHVISAAINGIEANKVSVEADVSEGMPVFTMVGYLSGEVREAQDRVRISLKNIGVQLPVKRITVNLAPADLRKAGSGFDLPIAAALLGALGMIPGEKMRGVLLAGELSLSGEIMGIRGILEIVSNAAAFGCHTCIIPRENLAEGSVVAGVTVYGASLLTEVIAFFKGEGELSRTHINIEEIRSAQEQTFLPDFSEVRGQEGMKRAAQIAVAGFHNLLIIGPPGAGKTMIAKRLPSILPRMTEEEMMEVSRIHSVAGTLPYAQGLMTVRPFRAPHHTATKVSLTGGGARITPGEISLAHRGVLYLDELPEFRPDTLEILRQPLEERVIRITRNTGNHSFPADFMLVASMNPCRCGYYGTARCRCLPWEIKRYLSHISQPLLDRMDLCAEAEEVTYEQLSAGQSEESSAQMRARVERALRLQKERYAGTGIRSNASLSPAQTELYCQLGEAQRELMRQIYRRLHLTGRTYIKILKVARTIADLEGSEEILTGHLSEAAGYRMIDKKYWGGV